MPAVQLLEQHDARELVGQRDPPERQPVVDVLELESERPADHEAEVDPALAPFLEEPLNATESSSSPSRSSSDTNARSGIRRATCSSSRTSISSSWTCRASSF